VPERDFSPPRLLFVGKGDFAGKGGPDLLAAFEAVRAAHPDAELWIVGQQAASAPPPGVRFMGRILRNTPEGEAEIDRLYREATLFVMPSRYEAFGIVFLEAMAYGLPCVASATCAMPEIVADGESGWVVPHGDTARLSEALLALAGDSDAARTMGAAGRRRLEERYTWDAVAGRIVEAVAAR
jgi:glycosyltransferase involved in cell wall biosynthesis